MKLLDLSHPLDTKAHGGKKPEIELKTLHTVRDNGVNTLEITFGNHGGTHIDAPLHLIEGGASIDRMPFETYYGTTVVLDIPKGPNGGVSAADLEAATPNVEKGDIVVIHCGWGHKLRDADYPTHHPYLTDDGAEWLVARQVKMVGMDVQSVDLPHSLRQKGFAYTSLRVLLKNGIPVIHNLTNLKSIAGLRVTLIAPPVNFAGADGAPARVVAVAD